MGIPSLQQICLIKVSMMFWTKKGMEKHFIKQKNGIANVENDLKGFKDSVLNLTLPMKVKDRLIPIWERVGYEIFVFITKSGLNSPEVGFHLEDIQWYADGKINEKSTYVCYFGKNPNDFLYFKCLCIICDEEELRQLWPKVRSETQLLKSSNLLISYWTHNFQDNLNDFTNKCSYSIVGFKDDKSTEYNMVLYCLNFSFETAVTYFLEKLSFSERLLLTDENVSRVSLFKKILRNSSPEHLKFICSFLEKPLMDVSLFDLITKLMPTTGVVELINYLLRRVNSFGNLHFNLLKRILASPLDVQVKDSIKRNLDFYVLTLMSKGHFECFEFLFEDFECILSSQMYNRLSQRTGLGLFYKINRNNQRHLLNQLITQLFGYDMELFFLLKSVLDENQ